MKTRIFWLLLVLLFAIGAGIALADSDGRDRNDDDWGERFFRGWFKPDTRLNNSQYSQLYQDECGSCHFPFQPVFLPAESWRTMMDRLEDHFGENAELSEQDRVNLLKYLTSNGADKINREIPNKVMWSLRYTPSPERITETAFFRHEHDEIPDKVMNRNTGEPLSFSNCDSCHKRALQGSYSEHEIDIPGIGRWDD
jgi:mono/diheme cytochrome c family protein